MATVIAAGGSINVAGGTLAESTAALRYVRATICNTDTITHTYHVTVNNPVGTIQQYMKYFLSLAPNEDRTVGPFSLTAAESLVVTLVQSHTVGNSFVRFVGES